MCRTLNPPGKKSDFRNGKNFFIFLTSHLRESVSSYPGLLLGRELRAPREAAFFEAPVDTDGQVVRNLEKYDIIALSRRGCKVGLTPVERSTTS